MPVDPSAGGTGYIRGGGGVAISGRRVIRVIAYVTVLVLVGLAVPLAVSIAGHNRRASRLTHGAPVQVTVTGCLGISSGIGMAIEYWQCRGSYAYGGHVHDEVIGGNRTRLAAGATVQAVVDRSDPTVVSTVAGAPKTGSYLAPLVLGAAAVLLLALLLLTARFRRAEGNV